jgi:hypothetical protein
MGRRQGDVDRRYLAMTLSLFTMKGPWYLARACRELTPRGVSDRNVVLNCLRAGVHRGMLKRDPFRKGLERIYVVKNRRKLAEYLAKDLMARLPKGGCRPESMPAHPRLVSEDATLAEYEKIYPGWMTAATTRLASLKRTSARLSVAAVRDRSVHDTSQEDPGLLSRTSAVAVFTELEGGRPVSVDSARSLRDRRLDVGP